MVTRLERQEVFSFFRPDQIEAISNSAKTIYLKAGDTVYSKGESADHFFILVKGEVALRLPGMGGFNILIDQLSPGAMFGGCISQHFDEYTLNAHCRENCELLKIDAAALKRLMDTDLLLGYSIQSRISMIYFDRYVETMNKLQSIIMNIPVET